MAALAVAGIGAAAYLHERDDDAIRTESAHGADASVDAHASAAKKPPAKKKAGRGGKTRVAGRPSGGAGAHPTSPHPTSPHPTAAHEGSSHESSGHEDHGGGGAAAPATTHRRHGPPTGPTYESVLDSNNQQLTMGTHAGADLSDAQLSAPMSDGTFVGECGAPDSMGVTVKVAIKMGRAVGVSVSTSPPSGDVAGCIDHHIRGLSWPVSPKMDSLVTTY